MFIYVFNVDSDDGFEGLFHKCQIYESLMCETYAISYISIIHYNIVLKNEEECAKVSSGQIFGLTELC